jgi:hypothetical protein
MQDECAEIFSGDQPCQCSDKNQCIDPDDGDEGNIWIIGFYLITDTADRPKSF